MVSIPSYQSKNSVLACYARRHSLGAIPSQFLKHLSNFCIRIKKKRAERSFLQYATVSIPTYQSGNSVFAWYARRH